MRFALGGGLALLLLPGGCVGRRTALPRPAEQIDLDWGRVQPWLPTELTPEPAPPELVARFADVTDGDPTAEDVARLQTWIDEGGQLPREGCSLIEGLRGRDVLGFSDVVAVVGPLGSSPAHLARLGDGLRGGELVRLSVRESLLEGAPAGLGLEPVGPGEVFASLGWEAACGDAVFAGWIDGSLTLDPAQSGVDLPTERLRFRDHMARLLIAAEPVKHDRAGLQAALAPFREPIPDATVAWVLASSVVPLALDILDGPDPASTGTAPGVESP